MSEVTELLRSLRRHGLTQTEIARLTGIPQPRLSRWERNDAPAGADDALKLAALARKHLPPGLLGDPGQPDQPAEAAHAG